MIFFNSRKVTFDRYEAEDAGRHGAVQIGDNTASAGGKARVASAPGGALEFRVHLLRATNRRVAVRWQDIGLPAQPRITIDGKVVSLRDHVNRDGWHLATTRMPMTSGDHRVVIKGAAHAVDVDYLELAPVQAQKH